MSRREFAAGDRSASGTPSLMPPGLEGFFKLVGLPDAIALGGLDRVSVVGGLANDQREAALSEVFSAALASGVIVKPEILVEQLPAGGLADAVLVQPLGLDDLMKAALGSSERHRVVWRDGDSEVLVHLDKTRTKTLDGLILVGITLECDETGEQEVTVPFAIGSQTMTAGVLGVTETEPRGHPLLVRRWGEAVVATAWKALLEVGETLASEAGTDEDGAPLVAGALVARRDGFQVIPQARHILEKIDFE